MNEFTTQELEMIRDIFSDPYGFWPEAYDIVVSIYTKAVNQLGE